jgi:uncharacterized membrane protein
LSAHVTSEVAPTAETARSVQRWLLWAVIIAFLPFAIACFILGAKSIRTRGWRIYGGYSLIFVLPLVIFSLGTIAYLINQNAFGNVNSPGSGTMNRIGLLVGPLAWYVISALLAMLRANQKVEGATGLEEERSDHVKDHV